MPRLPNRRPRSGAGSRRWCASSGTCATPRGGPSRTEQAQAATAEAFEESQRALAEAEMAVADLRAELERAEQDRDRVKRRQRAGPGRRREGRRRGGACRAPGRGPAGPSRGAVGYRLTPVAAAAAVAPAWPLHRRKTAPITNAIGHSTSRSARSSDDPPSIDSPRIGPRSSGPGCVAMGGVARPAVPGSKGGPRPPQGGQGGPRARARTSAATCRGPLPQSAQRPVGSRARSNRS